MQNYVETSEQQVRRRKSSVGNDNADLLPTQLPQASSRNSISSPLNATAVPEFIALAVVATAIVPTLILLISSGIYAVFSGSWMHDDLAADIGELVRHHQVAAFLFFVAFISGLVRIATMIWRRRLVMSTLFNSVYSTLFATGPKLAVPGWLFGLLIMLASLHPRVLGFILPHVGSLYGNGEDNSMFSSIFYDTRASVVELLTIVYRHPLSGGFALVAIVLGTRPIVSRILAMSLVTRALRIMKNFALIPLKALAVSSYQVRRSLMLGLGILAVLGNTVTSSLLFGIFSVLLGTISTILTSWFHLSLVVLGGYQIWRRRITAPAPDSQIASDDVSRFNKTNVDRIFCVRNVEDIKEVVRLAKRHGKQISIAGQRHTMGAHTITPGGYLIDTKFLNKVRYDHDTGHAIVEPGATWGHMIKYLNDLGLSPRTMQSYCSFSIGGTIAVNAHGITTDYGMYESVVSFKMINSYGEEVECAKDGPNAELFSLVIGGMGLFGIVYELTLVVVPNVKISMEMVKLNTEEFSKFYETVLRDDSVEVKIARINVTTMSDIFLFLFRRTSEQKTVSDLTERAREMNFASQFLYKWVLPLKFIQQLRYFVETIRQQPTDWSGEQDKNLLLFESALPLAQLYEPIISLNQTFILQEYFVPHEHFQIWMDTVRPIILAPYSNITLLNITIRYLYADKVTFLPYARKDKFAFVLYFRILRSAETEATLAEIHRKLADATLALGGTFYLPYRHAYTDEQLRRAYPNIDEFFKMKLKYDPMELFSNMWYERYRTTTPQRSLVEPVSDPLVVPNPLYQIRHAEEHRLGSYRQLLGKEEGRKRFLKFIEHVFNVEHTKSLYAKVLRAVLRESNETDHDIYLEIQRVLSRRAVPAFTKLTGGIKQLLQLVEQKREFLRETAWIVNALGLGGKIHTYASFGDSGKLVLPLKRCLGMKGTTWIVHDRQTAMDAVERGSIFPVGKFVPFHYDKIQDIAIPTDSVDLVTINMGLHHLKQADLPKFLTIVHRILRPGGVFLFREHDAVPSLIPMLDIAHSVFNVVTGVSFEDEKAEIRAFRPVEEWREIVRNAGFVDMMLYGIQDTDPTEDFMLCFTKPAKVKPATKPDLRTSQTSLRLSGFAQVRPSPISNGPLIEPASNKPTNAVKSSAGSYMRMSEWLLVRVAEDYSAYLNHTPWYRFPYISYIWLFWKLFFLELHTVASKHGLREALTNYGFMMNVVIGPVLTTLFLQLMVLALPIRMLYGTSNEDAEPEYEEVKIVTETQTNFTQEVDSRIRVLEVIRIDDDDFNDHWGYTLTLPRHVPFTEILRKLASKLSSSAQLISVSNQTDLQVEVICPSNKVFAWMSDFPRCEVLYQLEYPTDPTKLHVAIGVQVSELLELIRACEMPASEVQLKQVFDFLD